jgi:hypothetical protein
MAWHPTEHRLPLVAADDYGITIYHRNILPWLADHPLHLTRRIGHLGYLLGRWASALLRWAL